MTAGQAGAYPGRARPTEMPTFVTSTGMIEAVAALAVTVLAILGLAGLLSRTLEAIATVVLGVAVVALGGAVVVRYTQLASSPTDGTAVAMPLAGGIAVEFLGGVVAVVLGFLALLNVATPTLVAVAVVVLGGSLLLGGAILSRLEWIESTEPVPTEATAIQRQRATRAAILATGAAQALVGFAAIALGILALVGIQTDILILSALLALGLTVLLSTGVTFTDRISSVVWAPAPSA